MVDGTSIGELSTTQARTLMVQATASASAREAGIEDARGNLLPDDKLVAIRSMKTQYGSPSSEARRCGWRYSPTWASLLVGNGLRLLQGAPLRGPKRYG